MTQLQPERFVREGRANAAFSWLVVAGLAVTALDSIASFRPVAAAMALLFAAVAVVPAAVGDSRTSAYPWTLLAISAAPAYVQSYGSGVVETFAVFVGVATLALVAVLDVHLLTRVRLSTAFTTAFVAVGTMGLAGFWAVLQWALDLAVGSGFPETNAQLMWGFVTASVAGVLTALVFERYLLGAAVESEEAVGG